MKLLSRAFIDKSVRLGWNMAAVIATIFSSRLVSATV